MKKLILVCFVWCGAFVSGYAQYTQRQFDVRLWEQGLPNSNGCDNQPEDLGKGIYTPEIRAFLPDSAAATGRAVLACPGGGYSHIALGHEGYDWAPYFNEQGIALFVLKYRLPFGHTEVPISDAEEALRVIRENATAWHVNPNDVGIMGSSAGGHLASTVATTAPYGIRPAFQILFYPVISMEPSKTHSGSVYSLLGKEPSSDAKQRYSNENNVCRHLTPPAILLLSADDTCVPPLTNAIPYYSALLRNGIPAAMHVYPCGNHGWGAKASFTFHEQMLSELTGWLKNLPSVRSDAVRVACIGNSITDGYGIRQADEFGYPAVLDKLLGDGYTVRNFGVSGHTMLKKGECPYMNRSEYQACKDFNPNIVVIKLGTNDSKPQNWRFKDEFMADMQQMIDELKALPAKPQIYLSYPAEAQKGSFDISDSVIVHEIMPMIKKVAKNNRLELIDFHTLFIGHPEWMQRDGIHPNADGAAVMAETVKAAILKR